MRGSQTLPAIPSDAPSNRFWRPFLALAALGLAGLLGLPLILAPQIEAMIASGLLPPDSSVRVRVLALTALSLVGPGLLLLIAVAVGVRLAPRVGLRSHLAARFGAGEPSAQSLRSEAPLAIGLGLGAALVIAAIDAALMPFMPGLESLQTAQPPLLARLVAGMLYGGIVEELLLRWGVMTLLVWLGWRLLQGGRNAPRASLFLAAALISAVLFGALHLPALAGQIVLTPLLIARTIGLNALGGIVFGWLYWRRSLEAAMLAHAATHLGFALVELALLGRA
ncbi:CPBP family intramembrane glutamic endopeptidase [Candidatus Chloroploca asiatica]|uniref:CAAX prenyl protease 2/Lysostaphin resistance protein A-like domain-containing protein n=1 Tax=Candidatus Chloroploca asiatica TaxID=1506545 RepID=A0A2H3KPN7_9CHLR|nr:CPBP family intramembrane glutamic endopeptidase [Candidatus Chloroploca asiatica]PDW00231.1 hypothetical protein A9Q02_10450 [Candidatus Chloroploca asiatica]